MVIELCYRYLLYFDLIDCILKNEIHSSEKKIAFFSLKPCFVSKNSPLLIRLHYISPSILRSLLLLLSLQLRDLCPYASIQGLIRPSPPRSRRDQSDRYFLNMVNPRAYL